jgi:hypothetical protein
MEDLKQLATAELVDLLARETALYSKMLSDGASHDEFEKCKVRVKELQKEIAARKETKDTPSSV